MHIAGFFLSGTVELDQLHAISAKGHLQRMHPDIDVCGRGRLFFEMLHTYLMNVTAN